LNAKASGAAYSIAIGQRLSFDRVETKPDLRSLLVGLTLCAAPCLIRAQISGSSNLTPVAPAWAHPGSASHVQVAPPADFHRPSKNFEEPMGLFDGQSDIGSALVPGSAGYNSVTKQ
jgi:hypothetical protein